MDFRQVVAAILTMSMFAMLGNMIKKEHIDPLLPVPVYVDIHHSVFNVKVSRLPGEWEMEVDATRLCRNKFSELKEQRQQTQGYVFFSLTNGPEYHALQVAHAVFTARHLHATLVLPDIIGTGGIDKRAFGEVYDAKNFITRLHGIVQVAEKSEAPYESDRHLSTTHVNIPERVTKEFLSSNVEPVFKKTKQVTLASYHPSSTLKKAFETSDEDDHFMEPYTCLAIFGSLRLNQELRVLVNTMVRTLHFLSLKSPTGQFVAMDLNVKNLMGSCPNNGSDAKTCFNPQEIAELLNNMGFGKDTTLYITQTGWHPSLQPLRKEYPNLLTKDSLVPIDMKAKYLGTNDFQYEKYIDFYLCAKSKIFIPAFSNLFYASVSGMRIALGNKQVMVPLTTPRRSLASAAVNHLSPYVLNKTHVAFSCLC